MYPCVTCLCGYPLGDIYRLYLAMKADVVKARADCLPQYAALSDADEPLEKILDQLGLDQLCCRVRIMTNVEFNSIW